MAGVSLTKMPTSVSQIAAVFTLTLRVGRLL